MTHSLLINTLNKELALGGKRLSTRSAGLVRFVAFLAWRSREAASSWVALKELGPVLGAIHPRQVQRFLDALAAAALPVVDFESRTRGRWRLAPSVQEVSFDLDEGALRRYLNQEAPAAEGAEIGLGWRRFDERLLAMAGGILSFDHDFHSGEFVAARNAMLRCIDDEDEGRCADLTALALLRVAQCCVQENLFDEAKAALRAIERVIGQGKAHIPGIAERGALLKVKILLDQGKVGEASGVLASIDLKNCRDAYALGRYYNMKGLLGYKWLCLEQNAEEGDPGRKAISWPRILEILGCYGRAITLEAAVNDYQGIQSTAFNLGNLLLFAYRRLAVSDGELFLERGIGWIAHCEIVCNKFGVGGDSLWSRLALIEIALMPEVGFEQMNRAAGNLFKNFGDLREMAEEALAETRRLKNRLEEAEALRLLAVAVGDGDVRLAKHHLEAALDIWNGLGRVDKAREMLETIARLSERKTEGKQCQQEKPGEPSTYAVISA